MDRKILVIEDDPIATRLVDYVLRQRGYQVATGQEDVSLETGLPGRWEAYLEMLNAKQRHEVRRKLRRLAEMGEISYRVLQDEASVARAMDGFFKMFAESRQDKSAFLTDRMKPFFRAIAAEMAAAGMTRVGVLELGGTPAAMLLCYDYQDCLYLYNSGYDPKYSYLSVGLLSKVMCLKRGIEEGKKKFDFLKGNEPYKYRLGGQEVPLYRCRIEINAG